MSQIHCRVVWESRDSSLGPQRIEVQLLRDVRTTHDNNDEIVRGRHQVALLMHYDLQEQAMAHKIS